MALLPMQVSEPAVGDGQVALEVDAFGLSRRQPLANRKTLLVVATNLRALSECLLYVPQSAVGDGQVALEVDAFGLSRRQPLANRKTLLVVAAGLRAVSERLGQES